MQDIMQVIMQYVSTIGFPIGMCLLVWTQNKELDDKLTKMVEANTAAMSAMTAAVSELKTAIERGSRTDG